MSGAVTQRAHARLGRPFETALERMHEGYAAAGRAFVQRIHAPMRQVGGPPPSIPGLRVPPGAVMCVRSERSTTDYVGCLSTGRAVYLEAKSCTENRCAFYEIGSTRGGLREHQARVLERVQALGGLGLALVLMPSGVWAVDGPTWRYVSTVAGRKSWSVALFDEHGVRVADASTAARVLQGGGGRIDWLAAIEGAGIV